MARYYYLGPWQWGGEPEGWHAPSGTVGAIDLRALADQAAAGPEPRGVGLFATTDPLGAEYLFLGDALDAPLSDAQAEEWVRLVGIGGLDARTVLDALWETLTERSDADGQHGPLPLDCTTAGVLELHLAGHSLVKSARFQPKDEHWKQLRKLRQAEYKAIRKEVLKGTQKTNLHRMLSGIWARKYAVDYREFLGSEPDEPPVRPETTIAESFDKADSDDLGPDLPWTDLIGNFRVLSNQAYTSSTSHSESRADSDLSSSDHYAQADFCIAHTGVRARQSASARTCYSLHLSASDSKLRIYKQITGTYTQLAVTASAITPALPEPYRISCDGSSLKGYQAGVERISTTDTAIPTGTRGGIYGYRYGGAEPARILDNFEAADLAAPAAVVPWHLFFGRGI
ncbi:MAG TPA: hypothetical protein VNE39_16275 [Planctomycetota bacterium]|nr:hypothetical protein [Planctomycetota bacterium]